MENQAYNSQIFRPDGYNKYSGQMHWLGLNISFVVKLYVYDHCPYCVKARMIFGLKKAPFQLVCLLNDDEQTPQSMIGVKMVPILEVKKGDFMPESMDIVSYIDKMKGSSDVLWKENKKLSNWLVKNNGLCYELAMPRWVKAPLEEFKTKGARDYFQKKKEAYIGPFKDCLDNTKALIEEMQEELKVLDSFFEKKQNFFQDVLSVNDFHLFAFLRSLSIVKDLFFPGKSKTLQQEDVRKLPCSSSSFYSFVKMLSCFLLLKKVQVLYFAFR